MPRRTNISTLAVGAVILSLSACVTPRMYSKVELSTVEQSCGLSAGDVDQDEELKKVVVLFRVAPSPAERSCVTKWAHKNHLHLAVIDAVNWTDK